MPEINILLNEREAWALAQITKRLDRNNIGPASTGGLDLIEEHEKYEAELALTALSKSLARAGFAPR